MGKRKKKNVGCEGVLIKIEKVLCRPWPRRPVTHNNIIIFNYSSACRWQISYS